MSNPTHHFRRYPNATPFLEKMRTQLESHEVRNGLMLGLALRVEKNPIYYGEASPYFATAENADDVVVAALITPPHGVVLSSPREYCHPETVAYAEITPALQAIAENLHTEKWAVPTVHGPSVVATRFAELWCELTDSTYDVDSEQRAFELRKVINPRYSTGHLRQATAADYDLAIAWFRAFGQEALPAEEGSDDKHEERLHKSVKQKLADEQLFFWEDPEPVCTVGLSRPTTRGISIGPVYTPPEQRGHGYATSAVAQLSQQMIDAGKEFCTLFTDLANPTSNSIYQKIGYRAVGDFRMLRFSAR